MAEVDLSLLSLESELTCCICLSTFDCPVTIPCGHNFCQACLLSTWTEVYDCPQCRTHFAVKPELKKNTVLSTVVETFKERSSRSEKIVFKEESSVKVAKRDRVCCDTCMKSQAAKTCLTCMASFCAEHLRPHHDNPVFRVHQLTEPVGDLSERICQDHRRPMDIFCPQHGRLICILCLQTVHKNCAPISPDQQRIIQESDLRKKLDFVEKKIKRNETVISEMTDMQRTLKDKAQYMKTNMAVDYQQIKDMLVSEERDAMGLLDQELTSGQTKLKVLIKRFSDNISNLTKSKEEIQNLLYQSQTVAFLQASVNLPKAAAFDPYAPQINLDSPKLKAAQEFTVQLKEELRQIHNQPYDARTPLIKTEKKTEESVPPRRPKNITLPSVPAAKPVRVNADMKTHHKQKKSLVLLKDGKERMKKMSHSMEHLLEIDVGQKKGSVQASEPKEKTEAVGPPANITSAEKRHNLLKYSRELTFNPQTAHKRLILSEGFTAVSVSSQPEPAKYPDCPQRFSVCSQVLASQGFTKGRHYWEVRINNNNFTGIGLAYHSIDRKSPASRLGRNGQSWCVEWFNIKLSAWHDGKEVVLDNPNPKRVGVLLDLDAGSATFYNVTDRAYPFYSFVFPFTDAVFPAFWIFSSESLISLCKLHA
ncbi:E3 ubiquitin/ISG15 ligase TRIM25 [Dunckerocampus dactyliophorus]|uniref:E3 ubiquitin/ISG15 ligase TRIM25 n=1 Tax=Dunckerocampus dactyliophorus TaxID=161453 RepID=UPI002404E558|nr:E3 ubiquitin/ISG15 ligase TRIM25 [Dunckerocampus dactyliophorus]